MTVMRSGTGQVLKSGNGKVMLWRPLRTAPGTTAPVVVSTPTTGAANPGAIPGVSGWWDAGTINTQLGTNGSTIPAWGSPVGSLADLSTSATPLVPYHFQTAPTVLATPRLSGLLGGLGATQSYAGIGTGIPGPALDPDTGFSAGMKAMGATQAWTVYLVYSRPNWRTNLYGLLSGPVTLLRVGSTNVLQVDGQDGSSRMVLFPGTTQTVVSSSMTRRHTHHVILRNTPGVGVDVWLDGTQVVTAAPNAISGAYTAALTFLHDQSGQQGSAQCYFHEAAYFGAALPASYLANLTSYAGRWVVGNRKCIALVITGQSNAGNAFNDGAHTLLAKGVAWHLGALAWNAIGNYGGAPNATMIGGQGISNTPFSGTVVYGGSFLSDPEDGSDPAGWALGQDGLSVKNYLQVVTKAADLADTKAIVWPWSENDSVHPYSDKAFYSHAAYNFLAQERAMIANATAANMPLIWWNAIPFDNGNNAGGMQMHREVVQAIAADPTQNVWIGNPMTADSNPRGSTANPDGSFTGGDNWHRDSVDNIRFAYEAAPVVARAILASSGGDTLTAIPAGIPVVGGPVISHAYMASSTTVKLTITHDAGNDLIVPLMAAAGAGFCVIDGGTVAAPTYLRYATSCVRVDATHLLVTLAQPLVNAPAQCLLCYPYGAAEIGRGDAVTDNYASVAPPPGWNIGGDLGSSWTLNFPLSATFSPVALSGTP